MLKLLVIILFLVAQLFPQTYNPTIANLLKSVSLDSMVQHLRLLTGEDSVNIEGKNYLIRTRVSNETDHETEGHRLAAKYLVRELKKYCPEVVEQTYYFHYPDRPGDTVRNIIGFQPGKKYPEKKIIVSAHYDTGVHNNPELAPGADNNGSGVVAVLEAARLFKEVNPDYTLEYIFWDWIETGGFGTEYYLRDENNWRNKVAMFSLQMLAYDKLDKKVTCVYTTEDSASNELGSLIIKINDLYQVGLNVDTVRKGEGTAIYFARQKICPAVHIQENYFGDWDNRNPNIWKASDTLGTLNLDYFLQNTKLVIASVAELALNGLTISKVEETPGLPSELHLVGNYPNPFNAITTIKFTLPERGAVTLKVFNLKGELVGQQFLGLCERGLNQFQFDASGLKSGVYFYQLLYNRDKKIGKMVLVK